MAWAFVAHRGSANNKVAGTTISVSPSANLDVGDIIVVRCVSDDSATNNGHTVSDSKGNVWTLLRQQFSPGTDATSSLWASKLTASILTTDTITLTLTDSVSAKAVGIEEFSVAVGNTFSLIGGNSVNFSTATPTITLSGLPAATHLWLGSIGIEGPNGDTYTQDADYANNTSFGTTGGGAATNVASRFGSRIFPSASDTFNPTLGTSRDGNIILVALDEVSDVVTERHQTRQMRSTFGYR